MSFLRKTIFWAHLAAGLLGGVIIAIMAFTGAALGFEKDIIAWAERDVARVTVPTEKAAPLPLDKLLANVRAAQPDARPTMVTFANDPTAAVQVGSGREGLYYVDRYTGKVSESNAPRTRSFMRTMNEWHRWLGTSNDHRPIGRAVTGIANSLFLILAISGLYLWWPRSWSLRGFRAIAVVNFKLAGKARDWNWHNAVGLWSAPVLIVLTLTALPMSYRWVNDLIYRATGSTPPVQGGGAGGPSVEVPAPADGARPLNSEAILAAALQQMPNWETLTLRLGAGGRGGGGERRAQGSRRGTEEPRANEPETPRGRAAAVVTVREKGSWPRTATTTLTLNPYNGTVLRREGFADQNAGRQIRSWTRFLHTGEALGVVGKVVATLACLGGLVLVVTGFTLAFRRFFGKRVAARPSHRVTADVLRS